jgi:broad specificity phosphatase PhoE
MAKTTEIRVLLMRTGETEWENAGRIAGSSDVPLSEAGRSAVTTTVESIRAEGTRLTAVFCGPDEASQATAHALAAATGAKIKVVDGLSEMNLGLWEGRLAEDLEQKCPTAYRQWVDDPTVIRAPEGETVEEAQERIVGAVSRALDRVRPDAGAVGIVLRPVAMGLVGCALSGAPTSDLWSMMKNGLAQWKTVQRGLLRRMFEQARLGA